MPRDEPGGCPFTGQAVPGMKAARARSAASARNAGRRAPILRRVAGEVPGGARGSAPSGGNCEALSTVAAALADRPVGAPG